jgi:hypothetical protein
MTTLDSDGVEVTMKKREFLSLAACSDSPNLDSLLLFKFCVGDLSLPYCAFR